MYQPLTQIANEEGTDKGTDGPTPEWLGHNYTDVYETLFSPYRQQPITLLEIGLGVRGSNWNTLIARGKNAAGGASIRMWSRYFPNARIFGIDVNPAGFLDNDRIKTYVVDQGDRQQLESFINKSGVKQFDIIIDDGSHRPDHQQVSLGVLFPYLAAGGVYCIEDLENNGLGDGTMRKDSCNEVLNTRRVLRSFLETGKLPEPNVIPNKNDLAEQIEAVTFHCPLVTFEQVGMKLLFIHFVNNLRKKWFPASARFLSGTEELCVLRKKR